MDLISQVLYRGRQPSEKLSVLLASIATSSHPIYFNWRSVAFDLRKQGLHDKAGTFIVEAATLTTTLHLASWS